MATLNRSATKITVAESGIQVPWSAARGATFASSFTNYTTTPQTQAPTAIKEFSQYSIRPEQYAVNRTFLFFDLSDINGTITAIDLEIDSSTNSSLMPVLVAKSAAFGGDGLTNFVSSDFRNWNPSSPTPYSSTSGQAWVNFLENTFTLNTSAISDANTDGYLNTVLLGSSNDYPDTAPTSNFNRVAPADFNILTRVVVTYTLPPWDYVINGVSAKTELLSGYTAISGVSYDTIESVNDVPPNPFNSNIGTGFNGTVWRITIQEDGKVLIGGAFTTFKGNTRNRLVRLNADGTEDTAFYTNLGVGFNNIVKQVVIQPTDGKILVTGDFTSFKGNTRNKLIRLNSDGTEDTSFCNNLGTGFNALVYDVVVQRTLNRIIVVGNFTSFNGTTRGYIVRLNSNGTEDTLSTFYTNIGTGFNQQIIVAKALANGKIVIGGTFTTFKGNTRNRLVRINSDGTEDAAFYTNLGSGVGGAPSQIVEQPDSKILVAGFFSSLNGNLRNNMFRLNADGTEDTAFYTNLGTGTNNQVQTMKLQSDNKIVIGGGFTSVDGNTRYYLARINSNGTVDTSFATISTQTNNLVEDIAQTSTNDFIVGGAFTNWTGVSANRLINLNSDGVTTP